MLHYLRFACIAPHAFFVIFLIAFSARATGSTWNLITHIVSCIIFGIYLPAALIFAFARRHSGKHTFFDAAWGEAAYIVAQMILALLSMIFSIIKYVHYPPFHWEGADTSRKTNLIPVAVLSAVNCAVLFAWLVVVLLFVQRAKRNGTGDWGKGITWMQQDEAERQKVGDAERLRKVQSYDA